MARRAKMGPYNYERILGQRNSNFSADVQALVDRTNSRLTAVMRQSIQDVIIDAQTVGPSKAAVEHAIKTQGKRNQGPVRAPGKGGRMRVDTGFLRASGQASLNGMPQGPIRGDKDKTYTWKDGVILAMVDGMAIGATFYFGWTAEYAKYREAYDGFLEGALMKWQRFVDANIRKLNDRG